MLGVLHPAHRVGAALRMNMDEQRGQEGKLYGPRDAHAAAILSALTSSVSANPLE